MITCSLYFWYMFVSTCCAKSIQKNKCGGDTLRPRKRIQSRKSRNSDNNQPRTTHGKVSPERPPWGASRPHPTGPVGPLLPPLLPHFIHGQVWAQYSIIKYVSPFVLIRIKDHMLKHPQLDRKDYLIHDLRINSHNTFPRSHIVVGNLLLGTHDYLSYWGIWYSRIMRT
jgi:hypothetical protein